jgi:hypothetical protein
MLVSHDPAVELERHRVHGARDLLFGGCLSTDNGPTCRRQVAAGTPGISEGKPVCIVPYQSVCYTVCMIPDGGVSWV